jgi:hypothetical protein
VPSGPGGRPGAESAWFSEFAGRDSAEESAEDDRVLYVALTRAQDTLLLSGSMRLRTKQPSAASHDLVRLARILGLETPISAEADEVAEVGGVAVRRRVISADREWRDLAAMPVTGDWSAIEAPATRPFPVAGPLTEQIVIPQIPDRLSYTQLGEFEWCPRLFWVRRVLGMAFMPDDAADGQDPIAFGSALHLALQQAGTQGYLSGARLDSIGLRFQLGREGTERLARAVERYCASALSARANAGDTVRREAPFAIMAGDAFLLKGALDLYSRSGADGLVVDYKSGSHPLSQTEPYRLQADCYAMAALRDGCERVEVVFARVETDDGAGGFETVSLCYDADDAGRIERSLVERHAEMRASRFEPNPSDRCSQCGVNDGLCDARLRDQHGARGATRMRQQDG